ncbi:AMP-binding protein [Nonomuraea mesophila]|uniref:AMP-binding protein n=1 Tax=Nonomuraea mesophila TaxID=2530382 RepID=UPI001FE364EB|nr:AMP-binding protein [Nonomuraea mesophila]
MRAWADRTTVAYSQALDEGRPGWRLHLAHRLSDQRVYRRLRAALGGRVGYAISGGAPLGVRLSHFLRGIGITVLEGYGLTETSAAATVNLPHALKIGTVGRPLPGGRAARRRSSSPPVARTSPRSRWRIACALTR